MYKVCINCYAQNPLDAALCSECGMGLGRAPTGETALKVREEAEVQFEKRRREWASVQDQWRSRAEEAPSASGIVYLFGDRFVQKPPFPFNRGPGYEGMKVRPQDFANKVLLSAFVELAADGCVRMEPVEYQRLRILTHGDVGVVRIGEPRRPLHGLEAAIWESVTDDPKEDRVTKIIQTIIGRKSDNPWDYIVQTAKEGLREQGYLATETKKRWFGRHDVYWYRDEELIAPHDDKVDEVKAMLASFEASDPTLYRRLVAVVEGGIQSMWRAPDRDYD